MANIVIDRREYLLLLDALAKLMELTEQIVKMDRQVVDLYGEILEVRKEAVNA